MNSKGVLQLLKIRTGTFAFTNKLVLHRKIKREFYNKCICCKKEIIEDAKHLFFECDKFKDERAKFIKYKFSNYNVPGPPDRIEKAIIKDLKFVLGGDLPASGKMHAERLVDTVNFLTAISRKRLASIAECVREP